MAWTEQRTDGTFHIVFRIGTQKFLRSLRTKCNKDAAARCTRLDENLRLVESGRLVIPDDADIVSFLLSDGKLDGKVKAAKRITLGQVYDVYKGCVSMVGLPDL